MFWDQKASASHLELYRLIPERKTSGCKVRALILNLIFWFNNLCSIIIYMLAQDYLS